MSKSFIIVHRSGLNNPFLYGDGWGPDRRRAKRFGLIENAQAQIDLKTHGFGDHENVVVDEWEHPEVEEALLKCFCGDHAGFLLVDEYRQQAGYCSLLYFVRSTLLGQPRIAGDYYGGNFHTVYRTWEAKK